MPYAPEAGDLIWTDFDPRTGREQSGRRPALVVSPGEFCRATEFAIVCPITSRVRPFGTSVVLPMGLPVSGEILTSHVRSIDTVVRPISYAGAAVAVAILHEVRMKLAALIGSYTDLRKFLDRSVFFYLRPRFDSRRRYGAGEAGAQATAQSERIRPWLVANRFQAVSQASMMSARLGNTELASQWLRR